MVNPEVRDGAAAGIADVIIRNNVLVDCHLNNGTPTHPAGAISIIAIGNKPNLRPAGTFGEIRIEGNHIEGGNGAGIVVTSALRVNISGNRSPPPAIPALQQWLCLWDRRSRPRLAGPLR